MYRFAPKKTAATFDAVLNRPGRSLDTSTRAFFENRFGHDFANVRVHADGIAARSAAGMSARAYTIGRAIVFGHGEYRPETTQGRLLLAHELAHVVQQSSVQQTSVQQSSVRQSSVRQSSAGPPRAMPEIGSPSDRAEAEADAAAHAVLEPRRPPSFPAIAATFLSPATRPVVRRKTDETWAGKFSASDYTLKDDGENHSMEIQINFTPKPVANAEKIALVQKAHTEVDGYSIMPSFVRTDKDKAVFKSRMVDPDSLTDAMAGSGAHIDALPTNRGPLMETNDPKPGDSSLAGSTETYASQFGWRSDLKKPPYLKQPVKDAVITDTPGYHATKAQSASQQFETAALAIEGAQQGAYYGSARWGWTKESGAEKATKIEFEVLQPAAPSSDFARAAERFNASKNTAGDQSIPLPLDSDKFIKGASDLMDKPDKGKRLAKLDHGTAVETMNDTALKGWIKVVVTDGDRKGMVGWVKDGTLSNIHEKAKGK